MVDGVSGLFLLGQQSVERWRRWWPAGQQSANGDQPWAAARDVADWESNDRCHYPSLMQIQCNRTMQALSLICVCVCVYGPHEKTHACVSLKLMKQDRAEVDYRMSCDVLVTLVWAPLQPGHAWSHVYVCTSSVYVAAALLRQDNQISHPSLAQKFRGNTFGPKFRWVLPLTLKYAASVWLWDVLVI